MKKENRRIMIGSLLGGPLGVGIAMTVNAIKERKKSRAFTDEELEAMGINVIKVETVDVNMTKFDESK